jgi:putative solute:sodium symporter small subunit
MKLTARHRAYWRMNLLLTTVLLSIWFTVTFVTAYFAQALDQYSFLGFPLSFYIFAQGAIFIFLLIIGIYVLAMSRLDRKYGVAERR